MRKLAVIVVALVIVGWGVAAIVTGSAGLGLESSAAAAAPACLPSTPVGSAEVAGVSVSPAPGSVTASPHTSISLLGARPGQISRLTVEGSGSGAHAGRLLAFSQGDGETFVPDTPFRDGERVTVKALLSAPSRQLSYGFRVDTPVETSTVASFPNPAPAGADVQSFYTLPGAHPPVMTVTTPDHDPGEGEILTTNGPGPGQYGPLIYTPAGRLVWFEPLSGGQVAEDLNEQTFDGQRDLTWWKGRVLSLGFGQGEDIVMDSRYQVVARVHGGNGLDADLHDFQIAPGNVAYITAFNPIRCDLRAAGGERDGAIIDTAIQEIDMNTGLVRWEWHSLDHVGAGESEVETPKDSSPWDYFHLNSIDPEPDGDLLISARSTWAAYQLQGASGQILWRLGGTNSSFKMGPGTRMAWQHDGRMLPDGELTFFDDGSNPPIHRESRGLRVALDTKAKVARLLFAYTHRDPPLLASSQGNMQTLADGNAVVGYGGVPAISEYAPDGKLVFDAHMPFDMSFYRAFRFPWEGRPSTPPAVAASLNDTGEETIVHASWNGATGVSSWRVLAGSSPTSLKVTSEIPSQSFESSLTLPVRYAYVEVQALDGAGRVLAGSSAARVGSYAASL
jgi:Arylsulfotransferase (ASST)